MRLALALPLALLSACVSTGTFEKKEAEAKQLADELSALQTSTKTALAQAAEEKAKLEGALAAKSGEANELRDRLSNYESTLTTTRAELAGLKQKSAELEQKSSEYEKMAGALKSQIDQGRVELTELRGRMTVKLKDKILFSSGSARVGKEGQEALAAVAGVLAGVEGKVIRVEGHTDDVPSGGAFPTNWELSTARALAVVRFLQSKGIDPSRLAAAGYGEYRPIAPNDTPEGRSQNRRIEILLAPAGEAPPMTPAAAPAKP